MKWLDSCGSLGGAWEWQVTGCGILMHVRWCEGPSCIELLDWVLVGLAGGASLQVYCCRVWGSVGTCSLICFCKQRMDGI